jgi:hypothetical protein
MSDNDILVLPERVEPYVIDSSNGFMAAGVKEVDGTGADGMKDGSRVPIVSNSRLWFAMSRARRGIIGLGPNTVIAPSNSGFTAPKQPILQNEPSGAQLRYMLDGSSAAMVGVQEKLIECEIANSYFANFTLQGRDFGGIAYNGLTINSTSSKTVKRVHFDGCWRGNEGVPNGEAGGLSLNHGTYVIENVDFTSVNGPSPLMWNQTTGGSVRNARSSHPNYGMWTFWRCSGINTLENVEINGNRTGMNLEENGSTFELNWTTGKMDLVSASNKFHFGINPSGGSIKIQLSGVECSPNGYTLDAVCMNVYTTSGVQRRSDVSSDGLPIAFLPQSNWIN